MATPSPCRSSSRTPATSWDTYNLTVSNRNELAVQGWTATISGTSNDYRTVSVAAGSSQTINVVLTRNQESPDVNASVAGSGQLLSGLVGRLQADTEGRSQRGRQRPHGQRRRHKHGRPGGSRYDIRPGGDHRSAGGDVRGPQGQQGGVRTPKKEIIAIAAVLSLLLTSVLAVPAMAQEANDYSVSFSGAEYLIPSEKGGGDGQRRRRPSVR